MYRSLREKIINYTSDSKFSEILTGSVYALCAKVIAMVLTMVSSVVIARFYGANTVGVFAMVNTFVMFATLFSVMGTNISILRLIPEHITKYSVFSAFRVYRKAQYLVIGASIVIGIILFYSSDLVAEKLFAKSHLAPLFALSAFFIVVKSLMELNTQAVRGLKLVRVYACMLLIPATIMLSVLLFLSYFSLDINNPIYAQFAAWAVTAIIGVFVMNYFFKEKIAETNPVCQMSLKDIASISLPMFMTTSMLFFTAQTGIIFLGIFRSDSEVGYYSVAVKLATLTVFLLQSINTIAAPKFSELYHAGKMDELFYIAKKSTRLVFWVSVPILLFLVFFGSSILKIVFGADFIVAYCAMILLVVGQAVSSISGSTGYFMNMTGHHNLVGRVMVVSAAINIVLNFLLVPKFGINGAAISGMISTSFWNIYFTIFIKRKYGEFIGFIPFVSQ